MKKGKNLTKIFASCVCLAMVTTMFTGFSTNVKPKAAALKPLTITVFDDAANFQGTQKGWFGKLVKDKFNLTLSVLAPNVSGSGLYQTRAAAGDLGDLLIISNPELSDCIKSGLVKDMTSTVKKYPNLMKYNKEFAYFNKTVDKVQNPKGKIYGFPTNTVPTSPTSYTSVAPYSSPMLPWNYYTGIGAPTIKNLNGLMDVLQQMQKKYPTSPTGKKTIPITLWKDWDNYMMENARWLCNWYGYQLPDIGTSTMLVNKAGKTQDITSDSGIYKKILQFFYDANKKGLVDPDSASQSWNDVNTKLTNEQVMLNWYSWQIGFYNTIDRGQKGQGITQVPIADTHIIQNGDAYYGDGRLYAMGSKCKDPARVMQFMDWCCSTEGMHYLIDGIQGFNFVIKNGKTEFTKVGQSAFQNNTPVPKAYGGGGYQDGQSKINITILASVTTDPLTKEPYDNNFWSSYIKMNKTKLTNSWIAKYKADNSVKYYQKHNMLDVVPTININFGNDSSLVKNERNQCKKIVCDTSWAMVFSKSQAEFNSNWANMKTQLQGLGWGDLLKVDQSRLNVLVAARKEVNKK
jgi:putative aldouronate transport system substrate-binding protein